MFHPLMVVCPACNSRYEEGISFCPRDGTHVVNDNSADEVGKVLADRYKIVRKLGEGGMGEVYEASHVYIEKRFAIKLLRKEIMTNREAVTRFYQEARAASAIGHENIVEIDDFGHLPDGRAYLAMEYLEGVSLAEAAREPMAIPRAVAMACQVCRGLAAAHAKGIIHRDMKPENVFLVRRGGHEVAKILDFGIAKVAGVDHSGASPSLTRTGTIFGTPHYMSPEQALGKLLDHRTDIYSVGVILYEVATGAVPFKGDSFMAILTQHITAAPLAPRDIAPHRDIPPELERVILRAMAKEPGDRFSTMSEMLGELERIERERYGGERPRTPFPTTPPPGLAATMAAGPAAMPHREPVATRLPASSGPVELAHDEPVFPAKSRAPAVVVSLLLIGAAAGGGVWLWRQRHAAESVPQVAVASGGPAPAARPVQPPAPAPPPVPEPPPAGPKVASVLLDTIPPGAAILQAGRRLSDTPEQIDVPAGSTVTLELHHDGYRDASVTLDPAVKRKVVVTLERARRGEVHRHAAMPPSVARPKKVPTHVAVQPAPVPPPAPEPAPAPPEPTPSGPPPPIAQPPAHSGYPTVVPPRPIAPPQRPPKNKKDPYERLDKADQPLDPYR